MKTCVLFLFGLIQLSLSVAQESYRLIDSVSLGEKSGYTTDYLGNIYVFHDGDLTKYDKNGQKLGIYSTRDYGSIGYVDASNALKTLVVFQDFSTAVLLDANLSANVIMHLAFPGISPISLICMARDDGYWIYDESAQRLKKLDQQYSVVQEGTELSQVTSEPVKPDRLLESGQWLFLNDPRQGILVFDRYGTYFKTMKDLPGGMFQADGHEIIILEDKHMTAIDVRSQISRKFVLPDVADIRSARLAPNRIFIQTGQMLMIYEF